ncbi:MAG: tetratricopeptide repeat protein [Bacteroidales bacterium]|nr:tetratricopeptide repeat protein [Bacteroidales bacterium]
MMIGNKYLFAIFASVLFLVGCSTSKKELDGMTSAEIKIAEKIIDAATQMEIGNFEQAEKLYQEILSVQADNSLAYYQLAALNYRQLNLESAIEYNEKAISIEPKNRWYREQLAKIYKKINNIEKAAEQYNILIKQNPDVEDYYRDLIEIYIVAKEDKKAIEVVNRLEKKIGSSENTAMIKYNLFKLTNQKDKARTEIEKLSKQYPNNIEVLSMLAQMAIENKEEETALTYFKRIEKISPNDENNTIALIEYYNRHNQKEQLENYITKLCLSNSSDFTTKNMVMLSIYGELVDTDSVVFSNYISHLESVKQIHSEEAQLWQCLNIGYMRMLEFESVVESGRKYISLGGSNYQIYQNMLFAQNVVDSPDNIIETANQAIDEFPQQAIPYLFKGVNLMAKSEFESAIATFEKGLKRSSNNNALKEDFFINLADSYISIGEYEKAFSNYENVIKLNPNNVYALNNYAYHLACQDLDLEKAESMALKACAAEPLNVTFADTYAWVLFKQGKIKQAFELLNQFVQTYEQWSDAVKQHYEEIKQKLGK